MLGLKSFLFIGLGLGATLFKASNQTFVVALLMRDRTLRFAAFVATRFLTLCIRLRASSLDLLHHRFVIEQGIFK